MTRTGCLIALTLAGAMLAPRAAIAQHDDHAHDPGTPEHSHASPAVDCTTLATPPWIGLGDADRQRFAAARQAVGHLNTPEAAIAAGFRPALGDIPGMGVHYVHAQRSQDGIHVDQPDHLMFAPVNGEQTLVGAAYAFIDVPDTNEPIPFDSDLAHWHDHPQFAPQGQTLHMLHVWFVPSSNGPFAGLNFWLPFHGAGVTPPSACWMSDSEIAEQIQRVSFALVSPNNELIAEMRARLLGGGGAPEEVPAGRQEILESLDSAARANNLNQWTAAADRFLASLTPAEQRRTAMLLQLLGSAQMSSAEREALGIN
jgi:hypothetical protein